MRYPLRTAIAVIVTACVAASAVHAEDLATPALKAPTGKAAKANGKPAAGGKTAAATKERRPGELEGWDSGVNGPVSKTRRPADAVGVKEVPDGGLPLPERKLSDDPGAPIGFDKSGNMGGTFKF